MKTFNNQNITNTKTFVSATRSVFAGIAGRNIQVQELLLVAINEAAKVDKNDNPSNNLSWLSQILVIAEETKGINLNKIVRYVKEVLCCNTVKWNTKKDTLSKLDKDTNLTYNTNPDVTWFEHGKAETIKKAFDYKASVVRALTKAKDEGQLSSSDILDCLIKADIDVTDVMLAMQFATDAEQVLSEEPNF